MKQRLISRLGRPLNRMWRARTNPAWVPAAKAAVLLSATCWASLCQAQSVADFYSGKTIRMYITGAVGDSYDTNGRLIARHITKYIPGNPTIIVENMPGASGRNVANRMYNVAPKDGTALGLMHQTLPYAQLVRESGIRFESEKFGWIGTPSSPISVVAVWHAAGVKSIEETKKRDLVIGATSKTGTNFIYPKLLKELFGSRFRIVIGYSGGNAINLAMESGELDGRGSSSWDTYKSSHPHWVADGKIIPLTQVSRKRHRDLPNVPRLIDLAPDEDARKVFNVVSLGADIGWPLTTTPGVPIDRLNALREAFSKMTQDPAFQAEAAKLSIEVDPTSGGELQALIEEMMNAPKASVDLLMSVLQRP